MISGATAAPGRQAGWRAIGPRPLRTNLVRAGRLLAEQGLDGVVATAPANVTYVSGYDHWPLATHRNPGVFAVLRADGDRCVVAPRDAADYISQVTLEDVEVYTYGETAVLPGAPSSELDDAALAIQDLLASAKHEASPIDALARALRDRGIDGAVGVDDSGLSVAQRKACAALGRDPSAIDADTLLKLIRRIKTADEVEAMRDALHRTELAMDALFGGVRPGVSEPELERAFRISAATLGLAAGHCEVNVGARTGACFPSSSDGRVQRGDVVRADVGGRCGSYWADTGRTMAVGEPPARLAEIHEAAREALTDLTDLARPGRPVAELVAAGIEAVRSRGVPHYARHHVGHGIGLEMYEEPVLRPVPAVDPLTGDPPVLEEGMVLNLELPYYELGLGGIQIEDTVHVTAEGPVVLNRNARALRRSA